MAECSVNMEVSMLHIPGEFLYSPHSSNIDFYFLIRYIGIIKKSYYMAVVFY